MTVPSFFDLGVSTSVIRALADRGIAVPFPIQAQVLPAAMDGHDVLGRSQTGSGKTLAFAIPIVERLDPGAATPAALVLVPTRELAVQVTDEFSAIAKARGLRVAAAYGGVSIREQSARVNKAHILVATPGRLQDLAERGSLKLSNVRILVLDEADRMLDMGFQPQVDKIVRRLPGERQTMFFSATLDGETGRMAGRYTVHPSTFEVEPERKTVEQANHRFVPVQAHGKVQALVDLLREDDGQALVFVRTKRGADRLATRLRSFGIEAGAMHGDMSQVQRERTLKRFADGKLRTLIATDVAARGLDVDTIEHVVNYDPPETRDGYVHRVGRTARAGRGGSGVTFVLPEQQSEVSVIARQLELQEEFEKEGMKTAAPRVVFASTRGNRSLLARRPGRRF